MPIPGGASGKLGDRYEGLWAIHELLRVVEGTAKSFLLEPIDPDESRGIEFHVTESDGAIVYWSVKRQTTKAAGWTIPLLASEGILEDLLSHIEGDPSHVAVFASTLGAGDLSELRAFAVDSPMLKARLERSEKLNGMFTNSIESLCGGDFERARKFLNQTRVITADEEGLRQQVNFALRQLLFDERGISLDTDAIRGYLSELLLDHIHRRIDRDTILAFLGRHGIRRRDWAIEKTVTDRIAALCDSYVNPLRSEFINGAFIQLGDPNSIINADGRPAGSKILVVGGAGGGKSSALATSVVRLRKSGVPVIPIPFDGPLDGLATTTGLGQKLLLPESPALVLVGIANGGPGALVVDQLDTVSFASGRRTELWKLFDLLRREVAQYPNLSLIVGCRAFDLEHDQRLRGLKTAEALVVEIRPLTPVQIDTALADAKIDPAAVSPSLRPVIAIPLHLFMYLDLPASEHAKVHERDQLFDRFWTEKERRTSVRLGRTARWTEVIDRLTEWLSKNQRLSAPAYLLDGFGDDASAMASEHVLLLSDNGYRFFHEAFFDYAFARRFVAKGFSLLELMRDGEQHLFRRAQVRQVLAFLRTHDRRRYLSELEAVLTTGDVRFHIKNLVFQWISSVTDPQKEEWAILGKSASNPQLWRHIRAITVGRCQWFDVLDATGFFDSALSSGDEAREKEAIWLLGWHQTLETRSERVAELLVKHRKEGEPWNSYLRHICRNGDVFASPAFFDLFLSLIDSGVLDGLRPGFAVNDTWWEVLYTMAQKRPELACIAVAHWLRRSYATWAEAGRTNSLWEQIDRSGGGDHVIRDAAKDPLAYAEQILPIVADIVADLAKDSGDRLMYDPLWTSRTFGDNTIQVHSTILSALSISLEALAKSHPARLDELLGPYVDRPHDTIAYLVLRAWTAAPETYADRLVDYFTGDPRRLKIGYSSWSAGGGPARIYASSQAVRAASALCTSDRYSMLEHAILDLRDNWESSNPPYRGTMQLELLRSLDASRMSSTAKSKLKELEDKFPQVKPTEPSSCDVHMVGPPIPAEAQAKMSDAQWLRALQKYAGVEHRHDRPTISSGGEQQLANSLQEHSKNDPVRFIALANKMSDNLPSAYFDGILLGVANSRTPNAAAKSAANLDQICFLIRRVHRLPNKPCGRWIAFLIEKWHDQDWPEDVTDSVAWYAINDPDPDKELWKTKSQSGNVYYNGDIHSAGMNSVRGAIAGATARLLFDRPNRLERLRKGLEHLVQDESIAVRSCTVEPLLAVLNIDPTLAIAWFKECVSADSALFGTRDVERFLYFASHRNYEAIRPVLHQMLSSTEEKFVESASRQICLAALSVDKAMDDAESVRRGSSTMRKAATEVYAENVANDQVGQICRHLLAPFLTDADESVRAEAASAFRHVSRVPTEEQAKLLKAFLDGKPGREALEKVVRALEDSPVQLPDLVCQLAEQCIEVFRDEAGDITKAGSMVGHDLSKIVIRLYTQSEDADVRSRCLNLIDQMELHSFMGLSDELQRLDR
jgi:hypothetical protein